MQAAEYEIGMSLPQVERALGHARETFESIQQHYDRWGNQLSEGDRQALRGLLGDLNTLLLEGLVSQTKPQKEEERAATVKAEITRVHQGIVDYLAGFARRERM